MRKRLLLIGCVLSVLAASSGVDAGAGDGSALVDRFLGRQDEPLVRYTAIRHLEARNPRFKASGWMRVRVSLNPESGFRWEVLAEDGSSYIRNKVLRKALEGERDTLAARAPHHAALTLDNYDIAFEDADTLGSARLRLAPRRRDMLLVHGVVRVTDPEADLLEVSGRLAKNPSWWTKSVEVVRSYARINGVRVPVRMQSVANVRIVGRTMFEMTTEYESINGVPVPAGSTTEAPAARR